MPVSADPGFLWFIVLLITSISFAVERTPMGKRLSGPTFAISLGLLCGATGLVPQASPVYDQINSALLPVALPLLLFSADLRVIARRTGRLAVAFAVGVVGAIAGALVAHAVVAVPGDAAALTGTLTAAYIGGTINFMSTSQALGLPPTTVAAILAADNLATTVYLLLLGAIPAWRWLAARFAPRAAASSPDGLATDPDTESHAAFSAAGLAGTLALALALSLAGRAIGDAVGLSYVAILATTLGSVLLASSVPARYLMPQQSFVIGTVMMYAFFVTIGFGIDIGALAGLGLVMLAAISLLIAVHMIIMLAVARLLGFSLEEALIASCATISGPAATAAIASAHGWKELVTPGLLVGILGYVIANFIGLGVYAMLS